MICFEWLQRPENVVAGLLTWPDYRSKNWPSAVTHRAPQEGRRRRHPLEDLRPVGGVRQFYDDAEAVWGACRGEGSR